ncbi:MAG: polysaccharide deacetylase family protein [Clostridia bacterium]|nr:polysaccharide deacetylase family protein [Clostridia bacterium]MBR6783122.1 polysaccharide deacetylase family protein [Clostridia bacterium]
MKIFKFITAVMLALAFSCGDAAAYSECERINWFYKTNGENTRPDILGGNMPKGIENAIYIGDENEKTLYLTFDAGYSNENVEAILDVLKAKNIKAAFFILPGIIKNSPETVKRMADEGHLVCNHTTTHCDMSKITDIEQFKRELCGVEDKYSELTGRQMEKYFRPPEGAFSEKTLEFCKTLGYTPVFWSFAYADWDNSKQIPPEKAKQKVLSQIHDGAVLLLHPTSKTNALILCDIITELSAKGYSFGTLDELKAKLQ